MKKWLFLLLFLVSGVSFANDLLPFQGKQARLLTNSLSRVKVTKPTALMYGILMVATPMNFLILLTFM